MSGAYYNEIEPFAAAWLRNLIAAGHVAPGDVDERDIRDVRPDDLRGYTQCHFFAGIGGWSRALRLAGWPDDRPVWTGSCPCQPFSAAGRGDGFDDERHLWPHWHHLISRCRPRTIFGEQVASKDGLGWFDLVSSDLAGTGYAGWSDDLCAAGVGAPHIRQRLWFVANAEEVGRGPRRDARTHRPEIESCGSGDARPVADADGRNTGAEGLQRGGEHGQQPQDGGAVQLGHALGARLARRSRQSGDDGQEQPAAQRAGRDVGGMADADSGGSSAGRGNDGEVRGLSEAQRESEQRAALSRGNRADGFWSDADWIPCRDGKARPVEPGTFPLAHGIPARVGRLRAYGNAIVPQVAQAFIESYLEAELFL